jgi:hypothetical protein
LFRRIHSIITIKNGVYCMSKFERLEDPEWLKNEYLINKKCCREISEIIGCSKNTIMSYLKKYGIKMRSNAEAREFVIIDSMYPLLNDKEWLYEQYVVNKKSTNEICKMAGAKTCNSARQALIKFGIQVRGVGEGLTCNREDDGFKLDVNSMQVIEGGLLGDAGLRVWKKGENNANAYFYKKNIGYDHVLFVARLVVGEKADSFINEEVQPYSHDKTRMAHSFLFRTYTHPELTPIYRKWYPEWNNYKKIIPSDINITATTLLHWFMDDGFSYRRNRDKEYKNGGKSRQINRRKNNQICIGLCTDCFTEKDQRMVAEQMLDKFGLDFKLRKYKDTFRMFLPQSQAQHFFEVIGDCPVPSLKYKWKINAEIS